MQLSHKYAVRPNVFWKCDCFLQSVYFAHTPLRGLCFFRFHFPEGSNVKIVEFFFSSKVLLDLHLKWSFGNFELQFTSFIGRVVSLLVYFFLQIWTFPWRTFPRHLWSR